MPYAIRVVMSELQSLAFRLLKWFENNHMKANPGKSHILLSNKKTEKVKINDVVVLKRIYLVLLSILNLNLKNTLQTFVTKPVKKYMFCPELQVTCR